MIRTFLTRATGNIYGCSGLFIGPMGVGIGTLNVSVREKKLFILVIFYDVFRYSFHPLLHRQPGR